MSTCGNYGGAKNTFTTNGNNKYTIARSVPGTALPETQNIISLAENTDLLSQLSQMGLGKARSFSWDKCVKDTIGVYKSVING